MNTATTVTTAVEAPAEVEVIAVKGFDKDLKCRGFQYEIGKSFEHDGQVVACESGFHACERPSDVFAYYAPGESRFAVVKLSGELSRHGGDSKIAAARITIEAEIGVPEIVKRTIDWVISHCEPEGEQATGTRGAASATGYQGAASATGYRGAASATGGSGAASATGDGGAASATGYRGAASATGDSGAASATGTRGAAMASGRFGRAMGAEGCALFLVYRGEDCKIVHARAAIVGRDGIKPDTWYSLSDAGEIVEAARRWERD